MTHLQKTSSTPRSSDSRGPSSPGRRRKVDRPVPLDSFFCKDADRPTRARFLELKCVEEEKTFKSVGSCRLAMALDEVCGQLQSVTRQRSGTILLECRTDYQIETMLALTSIAGLQVKVETHPTLNLCKGVVSHDDFASESEEDLKSFFDPEGVVHIHRVQRKVEGKLVPTSTLILTFDRPSLPERIRCGYFNLRVRQYVPNPLRCFKCQRFGHTQLRCMSLHQVCVSCGQKAHESSQCQSSPHCVNCNGDHSSNSRECPRYIMEREIQTIRVSDKVSFPEARRRYQAKHPVDTSRSFAVVAQKSSVKCSMSCQTDFKHESSFSARNVQVQANSHLIAVALDTPPPSVKIIIPTKFKEIVKPETAVTIESSIQPVASNSSQKSSDVRRQKSPPSKCRRRESRSKSRSPIKHTDPCSATDCPSSSDIDENIVDTTPNGEFNQVLTRRRRRRKK